MSDMVNKFDDEIPNIEVYNSAMSKSLIDKIFFIAHVDADIFIDFGCANGELMKFLAKLFPVKEFIGYDISQEMINLAMKNCNDIKNVSFTTEWFNIEFFIKNKKSCLILSSVIHEVYSYGDKDSVKLFWGRVFNSNFDYIVIRDMFYNEYFDECGYIQLDYIKSIRSNKKYENHLKEFEEIYGKISNTNKRQFVHFLLKYFYEDNWEREVKENYLPLTDNDLYTLIEYQNNRYKISYLNYYALPYLKHKFKNDFGIDFDIATHMQIILEKR